MRLRTNSPRRGGSGSVRGTGVAVICLIVLAVPAALASRAHQYPEAPVMPGRIVYTRANSTACDWCIDLFVSDANGDGEVQMTTTDDTAVYGNQKGEEMPRWSPDGREIAFVSTNAQQLASIWRVSAAGGTPAPMVRDDGSRGDPAWHPTDGCIVYSGAHSGGGASTQDLKKLCPGGQTTTLASTADLDEAAPDWSPDGLRIAYEARRPPRSGSDLPDWSLHVMDADGSGARPLLSESGLSLRYPRWSPDGGRLAFIAGSAYGVGELRVLDTATGEQARLVRQVAGQVAWSPDGESLLFFGALATGPQVIRSAAAMDVAPSEDQLRGLYLISLADRGLARLRGAAGGAGAPAEKYEWGYSPDWWAATPTPTQTTTVTPTPMVTATASHTPTPTASPTDEATVGPTPSDGPGHEIHLPLLAKH